MTDRVTRLIEEYDRLGVHRTGTPVDGQGVQWFIDELKRVGLEAHAETLPFERLDVIDAHITVDGRRIDGVPIFDGGSTGPEGVVGTLDSDGRDGNAGIDCVHLGANRERELGQIRASTDRAALVVVANPDAPLVGLSLINAPGYHQPFGPPVLQVSNEHAELLRSSIGAECRVTVHVERVSTEVINVVATAPGKDRALAPLVVMTPRSSWWRSTGERGGGIAVFFEIARSIATSEVARTVHFVASTGHELGHLGLDHFLETHVGLAADAHAWIHLGANFAAASLTHTIIQSSGGHLESLLVDAMADAGVEIDVQIAGDVKPFGEATNIFDAGGRYISLLGAQELFHHELDRWPDNVDVDRVRRLAGSLSEAAVLLASS